MKEVVFVRQNTEKWKGYEASLRHLEQRTPDQLADMYIDLCSDLSFARTHYPQSGIPAYLNGLSSKLHQHIYRKKSEKASRLITYWTREIPVVMYQARKELLYSFLLFVFFALIGVVSAANDENFVRLIMGDYYVDMTLRNIADGDPMGVYKRTSETLMFLGITLNNVWVSFNVFISGILTSVATGYMLFVNGVMIGAFQFFFAEQGLLRESFLTIWIHGTLEISAIIVAGAGGLAMGNSWLFPGTYTRMASFRRGAKKGLKMVVGTVPIFIVAGFLESFVTRHTDLPDAVRLLIIVLSLAFVLYYFVVLPFKLNKRNNGNKQPH